MNEDWIEQQLSTAPRLSKSQRKRLSRLFSTVERSTRLETSLGLGSASSKPSLLPAHLTEFPASERGSQLPKSA